MKMQNCVVMGASSFAVHVKIGDVHNQIAEDVQTRFDTSNHKLDRPLPEWDKKKVIGLMKEEIGGKIMKKFAALKL